MIEKFTLVVGLLLVFLIGSIVRTTLLNCIDISGFSFGVVYLSNVHGAQLFASCPASFSPTYADTRFRHSSYWKRSIEESLEHIFGKHGSHYSCFTLSASTSENFDSCSKCQVPLHDCHFELIHVLGSLWRYELRHRRRLFHH